MASAHFLDPRAVGGSIARFDDRRSEEANKLGRMFTPGSALSLYAIAATFVAFHLIGLALYTGRVRLEHKQFVNAEDARFNKGEVAEKEHDDVVRVKKAHANLLENALPFFVVGALYAATAPSRTGALAYFGTFVGARVIHSIVYLAEKQPWRTISFSVGMLATIGMGIHVLRSAL